MNWYLFKQRLPISLMLTVISGGVSSFMLGFIFYSKIDQNWITPIFFGMMLFGFFIGMMNPTKEGEN